MKVFVGETRNDKNGGEKASEHVLPQAVVAGALSITVSLPVRFFEIFYNFYNKKIIHTTEIASLPAAMRNTLSRVFTDLPLYCSV
jgi:hypothetical protein